MRPSFFQHLHPPTIPAAQARWRYTLGAGGVSLYLFVVLILTGALEMFYYVATPGEAPLSVQTLAFLVPFGGIVRNVHFWAGQALVVTALVHLCRVVMTGAYAPPRRCNYLLGLSQLVLILMLDWSGYVLRWDEGVRWALVVGTQLFKSIPLVGGWLYRLVVGGRSLGLATLTRFYGAHIFALTVVLVAVTVWHFFRVRRDGGISAPAPGPRAGADRITRAELGRREVLALIVVTIALLLLATFVPAPIAPPIGSVSAPPANTDTYAPWFFLWIQGLVRLGDPFWLGVVIPAGVVLILVLIPFVLPAPAVEERGRWFPRGGRAAQILMGALAALIIALTVWSRLQ